MSVESSDSSGSDSDGSQQDADAAGAIEDEGEEGGAPSSALTASLSALEALVALARNNKLAYRGLVSATVVTVLARLACFGSGAALFIPAQAATDRKSSKDKKEKKRKSSSGDLGENTPKELTVDEYYTALRTAQAQKSTLPLPAATVQAVKILDQVLSSAAEVPAELASQAGVKLLSVLADVGSTPLVQLDVPKQDSTSTSAAAADGAETGAGGDTKVITATSPSVLQLAWSAVWQMHSSGVALRVEESEKEGTGEVAAALKAVQELLTAEVAAPVETAADGATSAARSAALASRLGEALNALLVNTMFTTLVGQDDDTQVCNILMWKLWLAGVLFCTPH